MIGLYDRYTVCASKSGDFAERGYALALNLVSTSEHYNKQVMFEKETEIVRLLKVQERKYVEILKKAAYITFDMVVDAEWIPITDSKVGDLLIEKTKKQPTETDDQEKERLQGLHSALAKDTDPKFCNKVDYKVKLIHLKDANGEKIDKPIPSTISEKIGQDINLKDVLNSQE